MDQIALVENQIDDGEKLVDELVKNGFDVTAACWVKTSDDGQWYLYIASPIVDQRGAREAYRTIHTTIRRMSPSLWVDPFEVKVIGSQDTIAKAVAEIYRRHPAPLPTRYGGARLGGVTIDGAYIYPPRS